MNRFDSISGHGLHTSTMEFQDYCSAPSDQLPLFDAEEFGAIDHFWAAIVKVHSVIDSEVFPFSVLVSAHFAGISSLEY